MALDNFAPSTARDAYYPGSGFQLARLWVTEKEIQTLDALGIVSIFEGTGNDPTVLAGYASDKLWLRADAGVTAAPGTVRSYDGSGVASDLSSWPVLDRAGLRRHLSVYSKAEVNALVSGTANVYDTFTEAAADVPAAHYDWVETKGYTTAGDGGGALYRYYGTSAPSHTGYVTQVIAATTHYYQLAVESIDPRMFGAVGGDTGNQTTALNNACAAAVALNVQIKCRDKQTYRCTGTVTFPANLRADFNASTIHYTGVSLATRLTGAGYQKIRRLTVQGDAVAYTGGHIGVYYLESTVSLTPTIVWGYDILLKDITVTGFGDADFSLSWVNNLKMVRPECLAGWNSGITLISAVDFDIDRPVIKNVQLSSSNVAYGISCSRWWFGAFAMSTTNSPSSTGSIRAAYIEDVPYVALDFHGGERCIVNGVITKRCYMAVNFEHATGGTSTVGCNNITISAFDFEGMDPATYNCGPAFNIDAQSGAGEISKGITITGGTIRRHGYKHDKASPPSVAADGGVFDVRQVDGLHISNVAIRDCYKRAFYVRGSVRGLTFTSSAIIDLIAVSAVQTAFVSTDGTSGGTLDGITMIGSAGSLLSLFAPGGGYGFQIGRYETLGGATVGALTNAPSVDVVGPPAVTADTLPRWLANGTLGIGTVSCDSSGNISTAGSVTAGGTVATTNGIVSCTKNGSAPYFYIERLDALASANDCGWVRLYGTASGGSSQEVTRWAARLTGVTVGQETARLQGWARRYNGSASVLTKILEIGEGVQIGNTTLSGTDPVTGGDKGLGTLNIGTGYYIAGNAALTATTLSFGGTASLTATTLSMSGTQVVGTRKTGYTNAATGTADRATALSGAWTQTISAAYSQAEVQGLRTQIIFLTQRLVGLDADLRSHGLIGA